MYLSSSSQGKTQKRSPFIQKSINQRLKEQDALIQNSSTKQLLKSLEICQKSLSSSRFPEKSESTIILKRFETQLLTRLNQLSQSPDPSNASASNTESKDNNNSVINSPITPNTSPPLNRNETRSIGSEGIVGFRRQLIQEQSFVPKSESLMAGMSMSQAIRLQEQNFSRERELAATQALSRLHLSSPRPSNLKVQEENVFQEYGEQGSDEDSDELIITEDDQPDVEKAWELAYQAGFSRGVNDLPQRMLAADGTTHGARTNNE